MSRAMFQTQVRPNAMSAQGPVTKPFQGKPAQSLVLELFGRPSGPYHLSDESLQRNLQPDDILRQYVDRELELVSSAITAAVQNDRASVMMAIAPTLETLETQFSVQYLEANNVPYSRVTNYGIPREFSYQQWSESYTTQRKKQMTRIEKNFLLDPTYGRPYWDLMLRTLGTNAKLTVNLEIIQQLVEQPFRNMFADATSRNEFDHNILFNAEQEHFGIAQREQGLFFKSLISTMPGAPQIAFDTVIGPSGTFAQLGQNAEAGGPMPTERIEYSAETKSIQAVLFNGPSSAKRVRIGQRVVDFIEVDPLLCNMQDRTHKVFHPFETTTTYAEVIEFDCGKGSQRWERPISTRLDVAPYAQTQTQGEPKVIEFTKALERCWLYNPDTGAPSEWYLGYLAHLNDELASDPTGAAPLQWQHKVDINDESPYGVDVARPDELKDKKSLKAMRTWREEFPFLTFDPSQRPPRYRFPAHMGDFHLQMLTNERFAQAAHLMLATIPHEDGSSSTFNAIVDLVTAIRNTPWEANYVRALIGANSVRAGGVVLPDALQRRARDAIPQWEPNQFGALNLPGAGEDAFAYPYPAGFGSWPGLQTLALEADVEGSPWRLAGDQARRVVHAVRTIHTVLKEFAPESELVDERNAAPWFQVGEQGLSVLLDTIVQIHTGVPRPGPVFLRARGADADAGEEEVHGADSANVATYATFFAADGSPLPNARDVLNAAIAGRATLDEWVALGGSTRFDDLRAYLQAAQDVEQVIAPATELVMQRKKARGSGTAEVRPTGKVAAQALRDNIVRIVRTGSIAANAGFAAALIATRTTVLKEANEEAQRRADAIKKSPATPAEVQAWKSGDGKADWAAIVRNALAQGYSDAVENYDATTLAGGRDGKAAAGGAPAIPPDFFRAAARRDPVAPRGQIGSGGWFRAPLENSGRVAAGLDQLITFGDEAQGYQVPSGSPQRQAPPAFPVDRITASATNIATYPYALNVALGAQNRGASSTPMGARTSRSMEDAMDLDEPQAFAAARAPAANMLATAFQQVFSGSSFGDYPEVAAARSQISDRTVYGRVVGEQALEDTELFGPWRKRLEWLRKNVANGTERVFTLALMLSRNNLWTHKALAKIGACLMRLDGWRTGVQVDTAALVRLIRGSGTLFHALARISVVPYLEAVTGDFGVVAEFFHGTVFTNRQNIDIMSTAVLRQFRAGKGIDMFETPDQLSLPSTESPDVIIFPDSENAHRISYPRNLLNEDFYYQRSSKTPSKDRKIAYSGFAAFVFGKQVESLGTAYLKKSHYWSSVPRVLTASRAFATYADDKGELRRQVEGTGTTGIAEFNTSYAWQAYNGKSTPPVMLAGLFSRPQ
jgi:hypothetical protein